MESFKELSEHWESSLAAYSAQKNRLTERIKSETESLPKPGPPHERGLFARIRSRIESGVETLKIKNEIRKLNNQVSDLEAGIGVTARECYERMAQIALSSESNVALSQEVETLSGTAESFSGLRADLASAIKALRDAAEAQRDAYAVQNTAMALTAESATKEALSSLHGLGGKLKQAAEAAASDESLNIGDAAEKISFLSDHAIAFSLGGRSAGRLNDEAAEELNDAAHKLQKIDGKIVEVSNVMAARRRELLQLAVSRVSQENGEFEEVRKSIVPFLSTTAVRSG